MGYHKMYKDVKDNIFSEETSKTKYSVIIVTLLSLIFSTFIDYWAGYIGGIIAQFCIGDALINGVNLIFDTARFKVEDIPVICGTLTVIGGFFK